MSFGNSAKQVATTAGFSIPFGLLGNRIGPLLKKIPRLDSQS